MRNAAALHLTSFQQAFVNWRCPGSGRSQGSGAEVAAVLERWLEQYPEHAETIQHFALGAEFNAVVTQEWPGGQRIAAVGLNATLLGALASEDRLASAVLLGLLAGRSEMGLGDALRARMRLECALDLLQRMSAYAPLTSYLQLQRHLLTAEVEESSLETSNAMTSYERAVELVAGINANRRRAQELEGAWMNLTFGQVPMGENEAAHELWASDMRAARRRAVLGFARTSPEQEPSRDAIRFCTEAGLPVEDTVLALQGVISKLPRDEIDPAIEALVATSALLSGRHRSVWTAALRVFQAEAWLAHGDAAAARHAIELVTSNDLKGNDAIVLALAFAVRARAVMASTPLQSGRGLIDTLLSVHAATTERLAGTSYQLRLRAACEPALTEAVRAEIAALQERPVSEARRQTAVLLDAMRAPGATPPLLLASRDSVVQRALRNATDRIGRIAAALASRGEMAKTLVLIIQGVGDESAFICVGGDTDHPIAVAPPNAGAHEALRALSDGADRAIREGTPDLELEAVGRTTFDALPLVVRERVRRVRTLLLVPDFRSGQDRVPIELLHDGGRFIGLSKVVARCLSVSHASRVLEAPLVSPACGRRALCASVANPPGLPALRFADREITAVTDTLRGSMWDATPVRESGADAQTILELAPLANLLHIACHGEASAGAEALVLADGIRLSAADIQTRHRLRGVVYLNACSLAQSRYLGGGVSRGVAYAFIKAGAPCVIANLLPVEDQGAAALSEAFYIAAREHDVGEAMRRAREQLLGQVPVALLTASVVLGDPFAELGGNANPRADATSRRFRDVVVPSRLPRERGNRGEAPADPRLAAAVDFARAVHKADDAELVGLAHVACDIGHEIGEAHCWLTLADRRRASSDHDALVEALQHALATLEPLRGVWEPAHDAHRAALAELRALDPAYEPRTLMTVRTESGFSINDRSDPAVDAMLSLFEAQQEHEAFWRGEPVLRVSDHDAASIAHNAVVWGYLNRVYDTGAEAGVAAAFAARTAWRGLVSQESVSHLERILAGLLHFLWGQQKVKHLEHWMASAHRDVITLAIDRVRRYWTPPEQSPALPAAREIAAALDRAFHAQGGGSKFALARAALSKGESVTPQLDQLRATIEASIQRLHAVDPLSAGDFGAWVLGELMGRASQAISGPGVQREAALGCTSIYEALEDKQEGWFMPYLMDGFKAVRESGGQDLFARWSAAIL